MPEEATARSGGHAGDARPLRADARRNRARLLASAETVLAAEGTTAPVDAIARHAGVGVGTFYRHFPTKEALIEAIIVQRFQRLVEEAAALKTAAEPGEALFTFFTRVVEETAAKKSFLEPLATAGVDLEAAAAGSREALTAALEALLTRAQAAGAVRDDVHLEEVMGMLIGVSMATEHTGWSHDVQTRALTIVFDGLRPQ